MSGNDKQEMQSKTDDEEKKMHVAHLVAYYSIAVLLIALYFLICVWPPTTAFLTQNATAATLNGTSPATLYPTSFSFQLGSEIVLLLIVLFSAMIGACTYSLTKISHHLGPKKDFDKDWAPWYYFRPFIGAGLALIFYFLVRGGLLTTQASLASLNLIGIAAVAGLVGMFSEHAMQKLQAQADSLFGATPTTKGIKPLTSIACTITNDTQISITIKNTGNQDCTILTATVDGENATISPPNYTLKANESHDFTITGNNTTWADGKPHQLVVTASDGKSTLEVPEIKTSSH